MLPCRNILRVPNYKEGNKRTCIQEISSAAYAVHLKIHNSFALSEQANNTMNFLPLSEGFTPQF